MEPVTPFPIGELKNAAERRAGNLNPYQIRPPPSMLPSSRRS